MLKVNWDTAAEMLDQAVKRGLTVTVFGPKRCICRLMKGVAARPSDVLRNGQEFSNGARVLFAYEKLPAVKTSLTICVDPTPENLTVASTLSKSLLVVSTIQEAIDEVAKDETDKSIDSQAVPESEGPED